MRIQWLIIFTLLFVFISVNAASKNNYKYYGQYLCAENNDYDCIRVKKNDTWEKLWPDQEQRDLIRHINRTNQPLYHGMHVAVPNQDASTNLLDHSPFEKQIKPTGNKLLIFNPGKLAWGAYDSNGNLVKWGAAAGGQDYCSDVRSDCRTKEGVFTMYRKRGGDCKSSLFPLDKPGTAPMPYCMFFHAGYAFHGSPAVPGYHASDGCVRVFNEDARWLHQEFVELKGEKGSPGTQVVILPYNT